MKHKKQMLILPFDHRSSFSKKLMGYEGELSPEQVKKVSLMKKVVFDGFRKVAEKYSHKDELGILVDEQFGTSIINDANKRGFISCCPVEKSGQKEFKFEYGNEFRKHIERINPKCVKVLVRYNPANKDINKRQLMRLKKLSDYCMRTERKLLFELLVPPTEKELKECKGSKKLYDRTIRVKNTIRAIKEVSDELYVDVWKLEGFSTQKAWKDIISAIKTGENDDDFSIIVLGRGEEKEKVIRWLELAACFPEIIGFAVGRTIFMEPLLDYKAKKIKKDKAVEQIAKNFRFFVKLWLKKKEIKL